jgi:hypothetical protein
MTNEINDEDGMTKVEGWRTRDKPEPPLRDQRSVKSA